MRLAELENLYQQHPGRAPGGTGTTGLTKYDQKGYHSMLAEREEYLKLKNALEGLQRAQ
jgi:hypothetical protein